MRAAQTTYTLITELGVPSQIQATGIRSIDGQLDRTLSVDIELASVPPTLFRPGRPTPRPVTDAEAGVFHSVALPVSSIPALSRWAAASRVPAFGPCGGGVCATPTDRAFRDIVRKASTMAPLDALDYVNRAVNAAIRYRPDKGDHWASVAETARTGTGDCEDYALAKRALLIEAGFSDADLQFIVLTETRRHVQHAVLAVHIGTKRYVLDNLSNIVASDAIYRFYRPIVSVIAGQEYLHGFAAPDAEPTAVASASEQTLPDVLPVARVKRG